MKSLRDEMKPYNNYILLGRKFSWDWNQETVANIKGTSFHETHNKISHLYLPDFIGRELKKELKIIIHVELYTKHKKKEILE